MSGPLRHRARAAWPWIALFAAAFALAGWAHRATLGEPYVVNNDTHQHIYWMQQWSDPELFADDLLTVYARDYQPRGFRALYRAASRWIDPLVLSRWLPLALFALSVVVAARIGRAVGRRLARGSPSQGASPERARDAGLYGALASASLFALSPIFLHKMAGGHPRAFAVPILLLTLDLLLHHRHRALALLLPLAATLYPMAALLAAGTATLTLLPSLRSAGWRRAAAPVALGLLLAAAVLVGEYAVGADPRIGPPASGAELRASPAMYAGGRQAHLPTPGPLEIVGESLRRALPNLRAALPGNPPRALAKPQLWVIYGLLALALLLHLRRRLRLPAELLALLVAGYALYAAAELLFFRLFLPRRYLMYTLPLLVVLVLGALAGYAITRLPARARPWAALALLAPVLATAPALDGVGLDDYSEHAELYAYLRTLPKDSLIAPFPTLGDGIPTFSARRVWISYELSNPYFGAYWSEISRRLDTFFAAYYAADLEPAARLCREHAIDVLVVDRRAYRREVVDGRRGAYFEPFSSRIRELTSGRESFPLEQLALASPSFTSPDGSVLAVECATVLEAHER